MRNFLMDNAANLIVLAVMIVCSTVALPQLGSAPIAVHWGLDGRPNGFADKYVALFCMPAMTAFISTISGFALHVSRIKNPEQFRTARLVATAINYVVLFALSYGYWMIYSTATGQH